MNASDEKRYYLPATKIIGEAIKYVYDERKNFLEMALLPIVVLAIASSITLYLNPEPFFDRNVEDAAAPVLNLAFLPLLFINTLFYVMFAVAWHRKWLLGEQDITIYSALKWDMHKSKFFMRLLLIGVISMGAIMLMQLGLSIITGSLGFLASLFGVILNLAVLVLLFARLSLLLPAAAVGDELDIKQCWKMTTENSWRLALVAIAPPVLITLPQAISNEIFIALNATNGLFIQLISQLIQQFLNYFGIAVGVSALSMAYVKFKEGNK